MTGSRAEAAMDVDEATRLLAGTTLIPPGSRLDEARRIVLTRLGEYRAAEQRDTISVQQTMQTVEAGSTVVGYVAPRGDGRTGRMSG